MLYLFRIRKIVKLTLEEYGSVSQEDSQKHEKYYHYPTQDRVYNRFKIFRKQRKAKVFSYALAIAEADKYVNVIQYPNPMISIDYEMSPTIAVTKKGIKLLTPTTFLNLLIGSISPMATLILSVAAFVVSIVALSHK